jgi:hypothetical protein
MENETDPNPADREARWATIRRVIGLVLACCASGIAISATAPYLFGWGADNDALIALCSVYLAVILPIICYRRLRFPRGTLHWKKVLPATVVVIASYSVSITGLAIGLFAFGSPLYRPVVGMSDRIKFTNVGPELRTWAEREMAAHPSPAVLAPKPAHIWGEYPLQAANLPDAARWIWRTGSSYSVIRNTGGHPIGVVIEVSYGTSITIYPTSRLEPPDHYDDEQPKPLHPYPGITVSYFVR